MANRTLVTNTVPLTAYADTTALLDNTYIGEILGGSTTQRVNVKEIYIGGQAAASAIAIILLSRDTVVGVTLVLGTEQDDVPDDPATAALAAPTVVGNSAGTDPQRGATHHLRNFTFNTLGGIVRWFPADGSPGPSLVGNTQPLGALSLSAYTGSTAATPVGAYITYETL